MWLRVALSISFLETHPTYQKYPTVSKQCKKVQDYDRLRLEFAPAANGPNLPAGIVDTPGLQHVQAKAWSFAPTLEPKHPNDTRNSSIGITGLWRRCMAVIRIHWIVDLPQI